MKLRPLYRAFPMMRGSAEHVTRASNVEMFFRPSGSRKLNGDKLKITSPDGKRIKSNFRNTEDHAYLLVSPGLPIRLPENERARIPRQNNSPFYSVVREAGEGVLIGDVYLELLARSDSLMQVKINLPEDYKLHTQRSESLPIPDQPVEALDVHRSFRDSEALLGIFRPVAEADAPEIGRHSDLADDGLTAAEIEIFEDMDLGNNAA